MGLAGEKVVVWGDSLGKGVVWNEARGRYGYSATTAASVAEQALGITLVNRSKFGLTAPEGMDLLADDLGSGVRCDAAVLEFGGNDCNFHWEEISKAPEAEHRPATLPNVFERTLCGMAQTLCSHGIRPILLTLPPIDAERYFRFLVGDQLNADNILKWLGDVHQIYRFQEMYSHIVEKVAYELKIQLLDLRSKCLDNHDYVTGMLCADGLHLNERGQRFVGEQIALLARAGA